MEVVSGTSSSAVSDGGQSSRSTVVDEELSSVSSVSSSDELPINDNDIAVIGYGCRVPGGNNSPSQLWDFLLKKGDASGDIPQMRWEPYLKRQAVNADILSKTTAKGYFLDRLEDFDAPFFGISPREAEQIDPQQRIAVEVSWEALENAGIAPQTLSGSDTAVFMGVNSDDYARLLLEDLPGVEAWMGVGTAFCGIPNRVSYLLDLMGPSVAVDGACASSLVAIHHGRQALLARETSLVIAGGVNALVGPGLTRVLDKAGAISADGRCRSFDDSAAGYGRGEGAGAVILKRMADALADNDNILAILKGSAVGADGRTNGIMAPNQIAQERVARLALKEAGVSAGSISYVEAHATSTPVGDPVECAAIAGVYGYNSRGQDDEPCLVGSIKANIGHLEAGAGVMGFIKAILALQHGVVPPQANLITPNSKIDWSASRIKVATELTPLSSEDRPRRAAVASYGYGGTVSHAVLEEAPPRSSGLLDLSLNSMLARAASPKILLLSSPQSSRIRSVAGRLARWLESSQLTDLDSVAFTLANKRGHHKFRAAVVAENPTEAVKLLDTLAAGSESPQIIINRASSKDTQRGAVWMFSGHGAQWKEMGQSLLDSESPFSAVVEELEPIIQREMGFSALEALRSGTIDTTDRIQVLTFVMHVGLAAVLEARGAVPGAVIGHSLGETAASVVAGCLSLEEGALIACSRARLYRTVAGSGAMVLVGMPFQEAAEDLRGEADIAVAIDSSPSSCVVSGSIEAVQRYAATWKQRGLEVHTVRTDVAFHSPFLSQLGPRLQELLHKQLSPRPPRVPLYSTSLQDPRGDNARDVQYWLDNMLKPVLLRSAVKAAAEDGFKNYLEVSSHPILARSVEETLQEADVTDFVAIPTMFRNKDAGKCILQALAKLHCAGDVIDLNALVPGQWLHDLPGTAWDHQPYWRDVSPDSNRMAKTAAVHDVNAHVLLGGKTKVCGTDGTLWQTYLDETVRPFPGRHPLHGSEIVPAAVLMNTFLSAASRTLKNVSLRVPVVVGPPREVQIYLERNHMRISSRLLASDDTGSESSSWLTNTTTQLGSDDESVSLEKVDIEGLRRRLSTRLDASFSIDYLAKVGVSEMGFPWAVLEHIEGQTEMLAKVDTDPEGTLPGESGPDSWASMLDAATSVSSTIFYSDPLLRMPTAIDRVVVRSGARSPKVGYIYVKKAAAAVTADVFVCRDDGFVVAEMGGLRFAGIEGNSVLNKRNDDLLYRLAWPPARLAENPLQFQHVLFVADQDSTLEGYQKLLYGKGIESGVVSRPEDVRGQIKPGSIVVFVPERAQSAENVYQASAESCHTLLAITKIVAEEFPSTKVFCLTQNVSQGRDWAALGQAPLHGLARIIQSEHSDTWGGLVDMEDSSFPLQAVKYVHGADVIRVEDTVARVARLRTFAEEVPSSKETQTTLHPRPEGTYIITGGLGALGLEVTTWLADKGARRVVLVSRRSLPPRSQWSSRKDIPAIQRILELEALGVTVYSVACDIGASDAAAQLGAALDRLSLPPVLGVIHAAGVLDNQLVMETTKDGFERVITPKIVGAMALHELFPPKSLDFFVLFSSCGQLLGFPGQASYASGNAFLDCLATHRRRLGDNSVSMMWTSWRSLGMAASTEYIDAELHARGITDVTKDEAFHAWDQIAQRDTDHGVILGTLLLDADEPSPHPVLDDIVVRRPRAEGTPAAADAKEAVPKSGPELEVYLNKSIVGCVATTLSLSEDDVDAHVALSELGMDSVMTVGFRTKLQQMLKVKVPPTLSWKCPTVGHLVKHFVGELSK